MEALAGTAYYVGVAVKKRVRGNLQSGKFPNRWLCYWDMGVSQCDRFLSLEVACVTVGSRAFASLDNGGDSETV